MAYFLRKSICIVKGVYMISTLKVKGAKPTSTFIKSRYNQAVRRHARAISGGAVSIDECDFELYLFHTGIEDWIVEDLPETYETKDEATRARNICVINNETNMQYIGHLHNVGIRGEAGKESGFNKPLPKNVSKKKFYEILERVANVVDGIEDHIKHKAYMAYATRNKIGEYTINSLWCLYDFVMRMKKGEVIV